MRQPCVHLPTSRSRRRRPDPGLARRLPLPFLCLFFSCGLLATNIGTILSHPRDYDGRSVTIAGEVRESANLLVLKAYVVGDRTGEITVVTDRAVPKSGSRVRVSGIVHEAFSIGDKSLVVLREASKGDP